MHAVADVKSECHKAAHNVKERATTPPPAPIRDKVKFHTHCIIWLTAAAVLGILAYYHVGTEGTNEALSFVPNFIADGLDRMRKVF